MVKIFAWPNWLILHVFFIVKFAIKYNTDNFNTSKVFLAFNLV